MVGFSCVDPLVSEWDAEKAAANLRKHGVAFEEALRRERRDYEARNKN
jgi:hypothetical protein